MGDVRVLLLTHPSSLRHDAGRGHPERPERVDAAVRGVLRSPHEVLAASPEPVDFDLLYRVHDPEYVTAIERFCMAGGGSLDADTSAVPDSWEAALRAAGAGSIAVEQLDAGRADVAFAAMRPPGHHAEVARAMGFCLFNNVAVTARELADRGERVAVIDWDVHHGNGTQRMFYTDPRVLYISLHQFPFYPGSGWLDEVGSGRGAGTTVNVPVPAGSGGALFAAAMARVVAPIVSRFAPTWLLLSAGYDAHEADPLAGLRVGTDDYAAMAAALRAAVPEAKPIIHLEGGYDLAAIEASVVATLAGLATAQPAELPSDRPPPATGWRLLDAVVAQQSRWWPVG